MDTTVNLNIPPLGSYDILIRMDRLKSHKTFINCFHISFDCIDDEGKYHNIKGIYRAITTSKISSVQIKRCIRKGCQKYAIKIVEAKTN